MDTAAALLGVDILAILLLVGLAIQDFRSRAISWVIFPCLFIVFLLRAYLDERLFTACISWGLNVLYILLHTSLIWAYFMIKYKRFISMGNYIGWGDICFWGVAAGYFGWLNFAVFFVVSAAFALLVHYFIIVVVRPEKYQKSVPLAGLQAVFLSLVILAGMYYAKWDPYSHFILLDAIVK